MVPFESWGRDSLLIVLVAFFESLSITQSVQSMISARTSGTHASQHDDLDLIAAHE